ncbi:hypothetical protein ScFU53_05430 [Streptococcus canis]|nr:hypothetical protein ScFU129_01680 [Streptococcus canis]GFG43531.1 hypothetical protein ScFU53_05430 [Streptococcus canis]GFG44893.1 hypothetical protein ScFU93_01390 [Streptococcus canis]
MSNGFIDSGEVSCEPDNIKVSINPRGGQTTIIYGDGSTDIYSSSGAMEKTLRRRSY